MAQGALGLIETRGLVAALLATDAASKAAPVTVSGAERSGDAYVTVRLEGELAAVQAAVEAGARAIRSGGNLIAAQVIPLPDRNTRVVLEHLAASDASGAVGRVPRPVETAPPAVTPDVTPAPAYAPAVSHAPRPVTRRAPTPKSRPARPPRPSRPAVTAPRVEAGHEASAGPAFPGGTPDWSTLEGMAVPKLRQFARGIANLPIRGRQISMANREQLLEALRSVLPA